MLLTSKELKKLCYRNKIKTKQNINLNKQIQSKQIKRITGKPKYCTIHLPAKLINQWKHK